MIEANCGGKLARQDEPPGSAKKRQGQMVASKTISIRPCNANDYKTRDYDWLLRLKECPVYKPTLEEFEDPFQYIQSIYKEASEYGICKIIPPLLAYPQETSVVKDFKFKTTVQQLQANNFQINSYDEGRMRSLQEFEVVANKFMSDRYGGTSESPSLAFLEAEFWHELLQTKRNQVEYGINVEDTLFSNSPGDPLATSSWNLKTLPKLPKCLLRHVEHPIPGVTKPSLYIGMLFGLFAWHVEHNYLYSINYHHFGAPKTWYGVPGKHASLVENVAQIIAGQNGADILAKKTMMFPPNILLDNDVLVTRAIQMPGEFVITFPRAYHSGFNNGFNCGESVKFAPYDWLDFGKLACTNYAQLGIPALISYDEIIFKECKLFDNASLTTNQIEIVVSFAISVQTNHLVRWCLWKLLGESLQIIQKSGEIVHCSKCGRDCYFSYLTHEGIPDPVCIFHDWKQFTNCTVYVHKDILEMEEKACIFQDDNKKVDLRVLAAVAEMAHSGNYFILKLMMRRGYKQYCKIKE